MQDKQDEVPWYECWAEPIKLTEEEYKKLVELLENPPPPSPALIALFKKNTRT